MNYVFLTTEYSSLNPEFICACVLQSIVERSSSQMPEFVISDTERIFLWVKRNRGACSRIAREHGFTPSFVRAVLYGHCGSTDRIVEKSLIQAGASFVRDRIEISAAD